MRARSYVQSKAQPPMQQAALTVSEYLELPEPEATGREELEFGWIVREAEANAFWHESEVIWLTHLLYEHVQQRGLGRVFSGRTGVVLDMQAALVVSPDVMVLLGDRVRYIGDQIWGPPSLVIEIASPSTQKRDREKKVAWYRTYGVQECWLIDTRRREIHVFHFDEAASPDGLLFRGDEMVDSRVLPDLRRTAAGLLDPHLDDEPAPRPAGFRGAVPDSEPPA